MVYVALLMAFIAFNVIAESRLIGDPFIYPEAEGSVFKPSRVRRQLFPLFPMMYPQGERSYDYDDLYNQYYTHPPSRYYRPIRRRQYMPPVQAFNPFAAMFQMMSMLSEAAAAIPMVPGNGVLTTLNWNGKDGPKSEVYQIMPRPPQSTTPQQTPPPTAG